MMVAAKEGDGDGIAPVGMSKSAVLLEILRTADILAQVRGGLRTFANTLKQCPDQEK